MTNSKIIFDHIISDLKLEESIDERNALAFAVLSYFGISRTDVISGKLVDADYTKIWPIISRLNKHEPLQYIFKAAWFCGYRFYVDSSVLIPRPETELLVEEAAKFIFKKKSAQVLDIGTGSGCIAISLLLRFPDAKVVGIDISKEALEVAKRNGNELNAQVQFKHCDILNDTLEEENFDLIVSNPPYISSEEKSSLEKNVLDYEPHQALFASDSDPLIFYRAIAKVSKQLSPGGYLMAEINERFGKEVQQIFDSAGLKNIQIKKDVWGKERVVTANRLL
jgi:release factor glutamine methyltransferase